MNELKFLVLLKGEDQTKDVTAIKPYNGLMKVTFNNGRIYKYSKNNVVFMKDPKIIDATYLEVRVSGEFVFNVYQINIFDKFAKLFYYDKTTSVVQKNNVEITELKKIVKSKSPFRYLKSISETMKLKEDDDEAFLGKQYSKINHVDNRTVLYNYLQGKLGKSNKKNDVIILPFGFNISQEIAVKNAMTETLSIIEGPPGTGKTQTILNIIANNIVNNKTIAVTSNNNAATKNIQEKLEEHGLSFISAFIGSRENKEKFIQKQSGTYPRLSDWYINSTRLRAMFNELKDDLAKLLKYSQFSNEKAKKIEVLDDLKKEYKHYLRTTFSEETYSSKKLKHMSKYELDSIITTIKSKDLTKVFNKILFFLKHKIRPKIVMQLDTNLTIEKLNRQFYVNTINAYERQIEILHKELEENNFENQIKRFQEKSMRCFKAVLEHKYQNKATRKIFSNNEIYFRFEEFIEEYPVILSTTHSLRNNSVNDYIFDTVVVDEASQSDIVSGALALSVASNAVIVGDLMQLPHVVTSTDEKITRSIYLKYDINSALQYKFSLLESVKNTFGDKVKSRLLKEHYRCSPDIIGFCNKKFYGSELIIHTEIGKSNSIEVYVSPDGNHARGNFNQRQIDIIKEEVLPSIDTKSTIGIITPFRLQRNKLLEVVADIKVDIDTVHKFQGREKDTIIISTVSNEIEPGSFVDNSNLINVAISRAKNKLFLVTSKDIEKRKNTNISDFLEYVRYNNFEITQSKVFSVFDALYESQSDQVRKKYKNIKNVSKYQSENLVNHELESILNLKKYSSLGVLLQYPMKELVFDYDLLTDTETKFARNPLSQVDFLLFSKVSKRPVLVVEVDGYAYHNMSSKQLRRDTIKDNILKKSNIEVLRLNTTGSMERKRIISAIERTLNLSNYDA